VRQHCDIVSSFVSRASHAVADMVVDCQIRESYTSAMLVRGSGLG